jgi:CheY-like chemotaxis protein
MTTRAKAVILVVDDEPGVRRYVRKCLVGAGYDVVEAANGVEAVDRVRLSGVQPPERR